MVSSGDTLSWHQVTWWDPPVTGHLASHCPASPTSALIQQEKSLAGNKIPVNIVYDFQQNEVTVKFPYSIEMTGTTLPGRVLCLS